MSAGLVVLVAAGLAETITRQMEPLVLLTQAVAVAELIAKLVVMAAQAS